MVSHEDLCATEQPLMIVDVIPAAQAPQLDLSEWSAAEFLDVELSDGLVLRTLICRLAARRWQWSISSIDGDRGDLICAGIGNSVIAARRTATSELAKCVEDATLGPRREGSV